MRRIPVDDITPEQWLTPCRDDPYEEPTWLGYGYSGHPMRVVGISLPYVLLAPMIRAPGVPRTMSADVRIHGLVELSKSYVEQFRRQHSIPMPKAESPSHDPEEFDLPSRDLAGDSDSDLQGSAP